MSLQLPPEDRQISEFTGWKRAHWVRIADVLLDNLRPHTSRTGALIHIPDGNKTVAGGLEGFARSFLLAALRLSGSEGTAPGDLAARYSQGLLSGTNPASRESWPRITDTSQCIVEAAFIAHALYESRPWIWDRFSGTEQNRIAAWLGEVQGKRVWHNNWLLFTVVVNAFLKSVGASYSQREMEGGLDVIDTFYRSDGWYSDGGGANYDYYVGWGLHFYTLLWCRMDGDLSNPDRAAIYRDRTWRFLHHLRFFFAANGAPVYQGRSLTYRLSTIAPFWAGALLGCSPLSPGQTRRLASGVLRHFVEQGAIRNGLLTRGWYGPFLPMVQPYSGAGSQYWASQGFLGLLLREDHAVWSDHEDPIPIDHQDFCVAFPEPGFLVHGTTADGIVRLANHGSDHYPLPFPARAYRRRAIFRFYQELGAGHRLPAIANDDPHYNKLAYSSHSAPDLVHQKEVDLDSQFILLRPDGGRSRRVRIYPLVVEDRFASSVSYPSEPDFTERVEAVSIAHGSSEIRIHHVTTLRSEGVRHGGFVAAGSEPPETNVGDVWAMAKLNSGLTSFIGGVYGYEGCGVRNSVDVNPMGIHSATPYLTAPASTRPEAIYVSIVALSGVFLHPAAVLAQIQHVEVEGRQIVIECEGAVAYFAQFVGSETVDCRIGENHLQGRIRLARISPDGVWIA